MTIKIRFHGETATIRWKNPMEKQFLKSQLTIFRDAMVGKVPILLRDERGDEIPKMQRPPMMPMPVSGQPQIPFSGTPQTGSVAPSNMLPSAEQPAVVVKLQDKQDKPEGSTC